MLVELILVQRDHAGRYTNVWGATRHNWPADVLESGLKGVRVASPTAVTGFRTAWNALPRFSTWLADAG